MPAFGDEIPAAFPSEAALQMLALRRSTSADQMTGPGPNDETLKDILTIAARVPDHRRVVPFRFIVFAGKAREEASKLLVQAFLKRNPDANDAAQAAEGRRFLRAPVIICVVSKPDVEHKTPVWEQKLTVGAVCMNMLLAASASGFAAQWLTEWYAEDQEFCSEIGVGKGESVAAFIYIGAAKEPPRERVRPDMNAIVTRFAGRL
jgi:nitroreductase